MLLRYSTYKKIEDCYKTPIQPTTAKLNTADGSPMSAIGATALHLRIAEFKFTHNFIICDQLPETEFIFGIDIQRKFLLSYAWDRERNCYIQREGKCLVYMHVCDHKSTIGTVNEHLEYHPNTRVSYPLRSVDLSLRNIWHTSLQMTILQRERIPILT